MLQCLEYNHSQLLNSYVKNQMDIQYDEANDRNNNRSNSLDGHNRVSLKSRKSNQSCLSIGGTHYLEIPMTEMQKISLQSNISAKAKDKFNQRDLFEHLAHQDPYHYQMRDQGSFKPKYRNTEGQTKKGQEKMSIEVQSVKREVTQVSCKCPKSKCLLMYCECFSKDLLCNQKCACYQCRNNSDFQDKRQKARKAVLQKDPNAFTNKLQLIGQQSQLALKKGCNCKKTNCSKKYCECFFTGVKCTYLCNCQNCMNGGANSFKS